MNIIIRYKPLKGGNYSIYLDYFLDGIRKYEFLKLRVSKDYSKNKGVVENDKDALALAETIRAKRQSELYHSKTFDTSVKQLNRYLFDYIEDYYKQTDRETYKYLLNHLKAFSKKSPLLSDINAVFINRFTDYLLKKVSHNSAKIYMNAFGMFMNKAVKEGLLSESPCKRIKPLSYVQPERTFLTLDELKKLFDNRCLGNQQIEQAFLFSCYTGLRFSDVKALKVTDITQEKNKDGNTINVLLIRPQKTSKTTGKLLKIPLSEQALLIVKEVKRTNINELLFDNFPEKRCVNKALKRWAKKAQINKNLHYHIARHTYATLAVSYGMDIYTVSKLLGHSSVRMTETYAKLVDEKKQMEIEKLPVLD